jgi:hypothetical protein
VKGAPLTVGDFNALLVPGQGDPLARRFAGLAGCNFVKFDGLILLQRNFNFMKFCQFNSFLSV